MVDPKTVTYYDKHTNKEYPVDILVENIDGQAFGVCETENGMIIVTRWNGEDGKLGYPAGRRGPCWMAHPSKLTPYLLDALRLYTLDNSMLDDYKTIHFLILKFSPSYFKR